MEFEITLLNKWATMLDSKVDIMQCIKLFDAGFHTIFAIDKDENFNGLVIKKSEFCNVWKNNDKWFSRLQSGEYIDNTDLQGLNEQQILERIRQLFNNNISGDIPVLNKNKIITVATTNNKKENELNWNILDDIATKKYCDTLGTIYLSSVANTDMEKFYKRFAGLLNIKVLNEKKLDEVENHNINCIIYAADIFPDIHKKIYYRDLYLELVNNTLEDIKSQIEIKEAKVLKEEECNLISCIEIFDEGFETIPIVNKLGEFVSTICRHNFCEDFPNANFRKWSNVYVEYSENLPEVKDKLAWMFIGYRRQQIPLLKNKKVVSLGDRNYKRPELVLRWDLIDIELVKDYFRDYGKLLLSSTKGNLFGFYQAYKDILDITILDQKTIQEYFANEYNLLIYGSQLWFETKTQMIQINELYLDLIAESTYRYLNSRGIAYLYFEIPQKNKVYNWRNRSNEYDEFIIQRINLYMTMRAVKRNDYYVLPDLDMEDYTVIGHRRFTTNMPERYGNSICFYGPCIAIGTCVKDEETIESMLQLKLNNSDIEPKYRVVNNGGAIGSSIECDINSFYRILDTYLKSGDIIVQFGEHTWKNRSSLPKENYYECSEPLNLNKNSICFALTDSLAHVNAAGTQIIADFMFEKIECAVKKLKRSPTNRPIKRMADQTFEINKEEIGKFLDGIEKFDFEDSNIGAIVMNCNPFTKGHLYLVEESLRRVDFLYIFVVEEDKSDFSFHDRIAIVKRCCRRFKNVKVVPSGKFIISSMTFGEYFDKDALQDIVVTPTLDVEIFGGVIASELRIKYRFVGEEPFDRITRQYNELLKEILPEYGVSILEIPRLEVSGKIVSASYIRKLLHQGDFVRMRDYLPEESYKYIMDMQGKNAI